MTREISVAIAAPSGPNAGVPKSPKISTAFRMIFDRTDAREIHMLIRAWPGIFITV